MGHGHDRDTRPARRRHSGDHDEKGRDEAEVHEHPNTQRQLDDLRSEVRRLRDLGDDTVKRGKALEYIVNTMVRYKSANILGPVLRVLLRNAGVTPVTIPAEEYTAAEDEVKSALTTLGQAGEMTGEDPTQP